MSNRPWRRFIENELTIGASLPPDKTSGILPGSSTLVTLVPSPDDLRLAVCVKSEHFGEVVAGPDDRPDDRDAPEDCLKNGDSDVVVCG